MASEDDNPNVESPLYTCDSCGRTFVKGWTDEEAEEEAKENFGQNTWEMSVVAVVCDDCYDKIMKGLAN